MGVSKSTLSFWSNSGKVRFMEDERGRRYLERDLVKSIQIKRNRRR